MESSAIATQGFFINYSFVYCGVKKGISVTSLHVAKASEFKRQGRSFYYREIPNHIFRTIVTIYKKVHRVAF
jgi:hypothetical protein